jgi:hypothetical protein
MFDDLAKEICGGTDGLELGDGNEDIAVCLPDILDRPLGLARGL